jgi:hypothetical protein
MLLQLAFTLAKDGHRLSIGAEFCLQQEFQCKFFPVWSFQIHLVLLRAELHFITDVPLGFIIPRLAVADVNNIPPIGFRTGKLRCMGSGRV